MTSSETTAIKVSFVTICTVALISLLLFGANLTLSNKNRLSDYTQEKSNYNDIAEIEDSKMLGAFVKSLVIKGDILFYIEDNLGTEVLLTTKNISKYIVTSSSYKGDKIGEGEILLKEV